MSTTRANGGGRGAEGGSAGFRTTAAKIPRGRSCLGASVGGCRARSGTLRLYVSALWARQGTTGADSRGVGRRGSSGEHLREPQPERAPRGGTRRGGCRNFGPGTFGAKAGRWHPGWVGVTMSPGPPAANTFSALNHRDGAFSLVARNLLLT